MVYTKDYGVLRERASKISLLLLAGIFALVASFSVLSRVNAAPVTTQVFGDNLAPSGWAINAGDGGAVTFNADSTAPLGVGSAKLTTDSTNAAYAELTRALTSPIPLTSLNTVNYVSKVESANIDAGALSFYLKVDLDGNTSTSDSTYLVYEPYWSDGSPDAAPVVRGVWTTGDVSTGWMWCSTSFSPVTCSFAGPSTVTLSMAKVAAPNAVVTELGVYQGTYNPSYVTYVDSITLNDNTYDFEPGTGIPVKPAPAAPAIAAKLLKDANISARYGTAKSGGNYISDVAKQMGAGTDFNGVLKSDTVAYECEVVKFLRTKGAQVLSSSECYSYVESVTVNSKNTNPTPSTVSLDEGVEYKFVASGTYQYANWSTDARADAKYSNRTVGDPLNLSDWVDGKNLPSPYKNYLQIWVDGNPVEWEGNLDLTNHEYEYAYTGDGSPVEFLINDGGAVSDNDGSLTLKIYEKLY